MAVKYNAAEVLEMALEIERNGHRFYRSAAAATEEPEARKLLNRLAEMEDDHRELFIQLKNELPERAAPGVPYDPNAEVSGYLRAAADTHVFNVSRAAPDDLAEAGSTADILRVAIQFEKDSVIYFLGLRDLVPVDMGREQVERLVREEMDHLAELSRQLERLTG